MVGQSNTLTMQDTGINRAKKLSSWLSISLRATPGIDASRDMVNFNAFILLILNIVLKYPISDWQIRKTEIKFFSFDFTYRRLFLETGGVGGVSVDQEVVFDGGKWGSSSSCGADVRQMRPNVMWRWCEADEARCHVSLMRGKLGPTSCAADERQMKPDVMFRWCEANEARRHVQLMRGRWGPTSCAADARQMRPAVMWRCCEANKARHHVLLMRGKWGPTSCSADARHMRPNIICRWCEAYEAQHHVPLMRGIWGPTSCAADARQMQSHLYHRACKLIASCSFQVHS